MNTRSASKNANANANNISVKDKFMSEVQALVNENLNNQNPNYDSLKTRIRAVIKIAKKINKEIADVLPYWSNASRDRILSVMFITMEKLSKEVEGSHIKDYIDSERRSLKIRKMSLSVQSHCGKALSKLWELIHNYDVSNVPNYDTIVELHRQKQNKYNLRPRTAIVYTEEDQVDDISDADYNDELEQKMARINRIVNYVVNKNVAEKDYEYDSSSDYDPNEDLDAGDDESLHFDDDDYAEESEEDDDDYEDEDEYRQADLEFLDEYFNDPDYIQSSSKKVQRIDDDDDEEYLPEDEEDDDDDYLLDTVSESDYDDDSSSDYDPNEDVKPNALDDHFLLFDDDDYAEESEEDDDDYEDDSADEEDAQFVSDYFNDPDYDPAEDDEEEDELEYDFSFKNKKENVELVLEAGIANDDGDDSEDYNPDEDEEDEDKDDEDEEEDNNKLVKVCKRLYNRTTGKVNYKWVYMTEDDYAKKYNRNYEDSEL